MNLAKQLTLDTAIALLIALGVFGLIQLTVYTPSANSQASARTLFAGRTVGKPTTRGRGSTRNH